MASKLVDDGQKMQNAWRGNDLALHCTQETLRKEATRERWADVGIWKYDGSQIRELMN
jgi:hypothetical protein